MVEASRTAPLLARRLNIDAVLDVLWSGDPTSSEQHRSSVTA
jgi:hypothetical protein